MQHINLALFASGQGSNALNIMSFFSNHPTISVELIVCNKADAPIVSATQNRNVAIEICDNEHIEKQGVLIGICEKHAINGVVLAGFLRKIPADFVSHFSNKILNIHPSLLPKYGGENMYGKKVHEAVLKNKEAKTGITIHFVNEEYDKGEIIAQFECQLEPTETLASIQEKIHSLEMENFPKVIEQVFSKA